MSKLSFILSRNWSVGQASLGRSTAGRDARSRAEQRGAARGDEGGPPVPAAWRICCTVRVYTGLNIEYCCLELLDREYKDSPSKKYKDSP